MRGVVVGAAALVLFTAASYAEPAATRPSWITVAPPEGWHELPGLARNVATSLGQAAPFGDHAASAGAQAFADPGDGAFYLSWLVGEVPATGAGAIRKALDWERQTRIDANLEPGASEELAHREQVAGNVAELELEWRHLHNETKMMVRVLAWVNEVGAPRLVKGECVYSVVEGKPVADVEERCRRALDSIGIVVEGPGGARLGALPSLPPPAAPLPGEEPSPAAASSSSSASLASPTVGAAPAGGQKVLYAGPTPAKKDGVGSWLMIVGGGLLLAGLVFAARAARARSAVEVAEGEDE